MGGTHEKMAFLKYPEKITSTPRPPKRGVNNGLQVELELNAQQNAIGITR